MPDIGLLGGGPRARVAKPAPAVETTITAVTPVTADASPSAVSASEPAPLFERAQPRAAQPQFAVLRERPEEAGEEGPARDDLRADASEPTPRSIVVEAPAQIVVEV